MSPESRIGPNGREDDLTRALRQVYAAPADPSYWESLEARIMARVRGESDGWWMPLSGWGPVGLIAAGLALVVAGLTVTHAREEEARMAYEMVIETPRSLPQQLATVSEGASAREMTLHFVIAP
ncbi:MAG TPA: hypothetical protein VFJ96_11020 [Gemmatimonadaceae bacterium]|jgi:hypothetical protein|nr:hypothetical protein [Gemmatimonadaceae bacterium]